MEFRKSSSGSVIVGGAGMRFKRLAVEQQFLVVRGANTTLHTHREYYPLMVGWRF